MLRRILSCLTFLAALATCTPAVAAILLPATSITAAITTPVTGPVSTIPPSGLRNLTIEAEFSGVSGGTSVDAYVQTSFDGGATWVDIRNFHFTTSNANSIVNHSSGTAVTTAITPSDGSMSSNTSQDGVIGSLLRVKYKSSGTYGAGTTLAIFVDGVAVRRQ